jgi:enamine deaminase RidA (YjgF/YER057c/UK114 family)
MARPEMAARRHVRSGTEYERRYGYSRAVRAGDRVLVAGCAPIWPDGSCDPDPRAQARRCFEIITAALEELDAGPGDVVRTSIFITDPEAAVAVGETHHEFFGEAEPASTMVVVAALVDPRWVVEVEAEAQVG